MASNINVVVIDGNLTRDSELRQSQGGSPILTFGIAVNDRRKNPATGEWEDYANYVDVVLFGNRAQSLAQYLTRGTKVCVSGKLRWSSWEKDGQKRSKLEVVADEVSLPPRGQGQQAQQYAPAAPQTAYAAPQAAPTYAAPPQPQAAPQAAPQPAQAYPAGQGVYQPTITQPVMSAELPSDGDEIPF